MQKGCMFEFSFEFDLYRDLIRQLLSERCKDQLLNKIVGELLTSHVSFVLNQNLSDYYRESMNIYSIINDVLEVSFGDTYDQKKLYRLEDEVDEITHILQNRILEMFRDTDISYALWSVRHLTSYIKAIEYIGDYRIMEWHERAGIPYLGEMTKTRYEFSLSSLYTTLGNELQPYRGRYASKFLDRHLDTFVRNLIEESIFLNGNRTTDDPSTYLVSVLHNEVVSIDYPYTREHISKSFPLMEPDQVRHVIDACVLVIETELQNTIKAAVHLDDVDSWFISEKVLTIIIDRPLTQIDFGERLKVDIKTAIDNGDWVPPKQRNLVGY